MQNGLVESFNGRRRDACLNEHLFTNLKEATRASWGEQVEPIRPARSAGPTRPHPGFAIDATPGLPYSRAELPSLQKH
jgi:hypothetical protein